MGFQEDASSSRRVGGAPAYRPRSLLSSPPDILAISRYSSSVSSSLGLEAPGLPWLCPTRPHMGNLRPPRHGEKHPTDQRDDMFLRKTAVAAGLLLSKMPGEGGVHGQVVGGRAHTALRSGCSCRH